MSKIIGLLTTTDSGKSLLQDYFRKNFKNQMYESTNHGPGQITDSLKTIDKSKLEDRNVVLDLIKKHGCDTLLFDWVKKQFNNKSMKNMFKEHITDKKMIFVFVRPIDFDHYCDHGVYVARDVRPRWAVSQHRKLGVEGYAGILQNFFTMYDQLSDKSKVMEIIFEDLIENPKVILNKIIDKFGFIKEREFVESTKQYNKWLTEIDLKNIRTYVEDGQLLKQEELDYLSEFFADYNKKFGYPEQMLISDIYPETLVDDINNYLKRKS
jgi:hypothetical protein